MKKIKKIIIINLIIFTFFISSPAYAINLLEKLSVFAVVAGYSDLEHETNTSPVEKVAAAIGLVLSWILGFLGVIFMGLMIYAGLLWMTAQGNEQQVNKAKETLQNATIGLVIVAISFAVSLFVSYIVKSAGMFK